MPVPQDPEALEALRRVVAACDPIELTALGVLVPGFGSLVLALAVVQGRLEAAEGAQALDPRRDLPGGILGPRPRDRRRRRRIATEVAQAERLLAPGPGSS